MLDSLQEVYGAIRRKKLRTIATGFAVSSGLFLLIVLQGAGNGLIHSFEYNLRGFAFDVINVYGGRTTKPFEGVKEGRSITLDDRDVKMTHSSFDDVVSESVPSISQGGQRLRLADKFVPDVTLQGVYPDEQATSSLKMLSGRFVNDIDLKEKRKVVVLADKNVRDVFPKGANPVGSNVLINGINYKVVGVYEADQMRNSSKAYVPFTTLSIIYSRGRNIDMLSMRVNNLDDEQKMESFMDDYTRATSLIHTFAPDDRQALWIWNQARENMQVTSAMSMLHTAFWVLGILTLVSGIVGVSNIMLISVRERTREFGIRRAIGAHQWSIIRMVVFESVVVTTIFGYIGMLFGIFFCEWMDMTVGNQTLDLGVFQSKVFIDPTVDLATCMKATLIMIVAGAIAGFLPARKAVKVKPIEALHSS